MAFDTSDKGAATAAATHSLYFALRPDAEFADYALRQAARIRRREGMTAWPVAADRLHVSLNSLGRHGVVCEWLVARAAAAARTVRMNPFLVGFDQAATWGKGDGRRPLVLTGEDGLEGVNILHGAIHAALAAAGLAPRRERPIAPHMTLLRDVRIASPEPIAPMVWRVREFVLLNSWRGKGRHEVLGRFPLG